MQSIFNIVFTTSLYATIVGLVIVLIKGILKNRLNARCSMHAIIVWGYSSPNTIVFQGSRIKQSGARIYTAS